MVLSENDNLMKIDNAIKAIVEGLCKKVEISENCKVYSMGEGKIRIDIKY